MRPGRGSIRQSGSRIALASSNPSDVSLLVVTGMQRSHMADGNLQLPVVNHARVPRRVFLSANGNVNSPATWSGIPYHFLLEARRKGLVDEGLTLRPDTRGMRFRRVAWNAARLMTLKHAGGFQYSPGFLEQLYKPVRSTISGGVVVSCFQLLPPSVIKDSSIEKWFYIDMTLRQFFEYYGVESSVGNAREAVESERTGYASAVGIITHSRWAALSVMQDYGITPDRVHTVVPGASLSLDQYAMWEHDHRAPADVMEMRPLRLVFVGKYWKRKGLDRLLLAFRAACDRGMKASLRVIGCPRDSVPADLRETNAVEWVGFVDKGKDPQRLLKLVSECDIGCLLSRSEAGGIALREYLALGLVTIGPETGGAEEHMARGASVAVPSDAGTEEIAEVLLGFDRDRRKLREFRAAAWNYRCQALWSNSVDQILSFWPQSVRNTVRVEA